VITSVRAELSRDHVRPRIGLLEQAGAGDPNIGLAASSIRSTRRVAPPASQLVPARAPVTPIGRFSPP